MVKPSAKQQEEIEAIRRKYLPKEEDKMEQLRQMVYFLKGEILYSRAPLAEALEQAGKRSGGELGRFF